MYHGVKVYSSINLPTGIDFLLMHTDTVGQPVIVNQYSEPEKIQLSNDYAVSLSMTTAQRPLHLTSYSKGQHPQRQEVINVQLG